ncbi:MAG: cyclic nucleotide-binding domain-containing protein [Halomonas sp.]|uniref:cyclic nucleotide-binding domain-containing protein n=1 Tax=Halomonas sp. TaxID=1486246 RepID=UPI00286FF141|nr:cyclic nucleotide-binding domain-containing protein [Halomonas sp.]MDR9440414.1 cyclic nucleotide-binding domain-containing protein [Halomonas sp.]
MNSPYLDADHEALLLHHCHQHPYQRKTVILNGGAQSDALLYLVKGVAKVMLINADGQEMIITYMGPGEFAGEMGVFCPEARRSAWVVAHSDCQVASLPYARFHTLAAAHPALLYALGQQLSVRLTKTTQRASDFAFHDVVGRIRRCLRELAHLAAKAKCDGVTIHYTRQELALMAGCTREMAGRALKALESNGLVQVQGRSIQVSGELMQPEERQEA